MGSMIRFCTILLMAALAFGPAQPALADDHDHDHHDDRAVEWDPEFLNLDQQGFGILPLHRAAEIVSQRFRGRLIAARLVPPRPEERARGVALVHELRLLTPDRDVLLIWLDARSGAFLEVAGTGLTKARRKGDRK